VTARLLIIGSALVIVAAVTVMIVTAARDAIDCDQFRFGREEWIAARAPAGGDPDRARAIARGISECGLLDGLAAVAVQRQLGRPNGDGPVWEYRLGPGKRGTGDDDYLEVGFDIDPAEPLDSRVKDVDLSLH
jgi:hypothetical protein